MQQQGRMLYARQKFLIDAIIMTKYDSTAKGGVAVSIGRELGLPVAFVCTGEGYKDIGSFNAEAYINDFLGL